MGIYGGFAGDETERSERDWQRNVTVLSGDIDGNDEVDANGIVTDTAGIRVHNAYHVVTGSGTDATAVLDGFAINGGNAGNDSWAHGGGMLNVDGSPLLTNLEFIGNRAGGGGMFNGHDGNPVLTNVTFRRNLSHSTGGGLFNRGGNAVLTNVTFYRNNARTVAGGISNRPGGVLTITNSRVISNSTLDGGTHMEGGGIWNGGVIQISNSRIAGNFTGNSDGYFDAGDGGGIWNNGTAEISNSELEGNYTGGGIHYQWNDGGRGGAIFNASPGALVINATSVVLNHTGNGGDQISDVGGSGNGGHGGGLFNTGVLTVTASVIGENRTGNGGQPVGEQESHGGNGGGLYNTINGSAMIMSSSIISNSTGTSRGSGAQSAGGGVYNETGTLRLVNSTVSGNEAEGNGGGLTVYPDFINGNDSSLYNVTIVGNRADADEDEIGNGGGFFNAGTVYSYNSILAGNSDGSPGTAHPDCSFNVTFGGSFTAARYNLVGNKTGCEGQFEAADGNLVNLAPGLAALGEYGGSTPTHTLLPTSPARDAGDPSGCAGPNGDPLSTDQRGEPRPETAGARCDIGAVEYPPPISIHLAPTSVLENSGEPLTVTFTRTQNTEGVITATLDVDGSATFNTDYTLSGAASFDGSSGTVIFGDGQMTSTLLITPTADLIAEPDETVVITITDSTENGPGTPVTGTGTIVDDDSAGMLVSPTDGLTTTEVGDTVTFSVTLQSEPTGTVTVTLTSDDPGEGAVSPTTLTFNATNWRTPQTVTVTGVDDDEHDGDVTYTSQIAVSSDDPNYDDIEASDVGVTNLDDEEEYRIYLPHVVGSP